MSKEASSPHISVLLDEVIENLALKENGTYIDCTFGAGGYSKRILSSSTCNVVGIDQDPHVKQHVENLSSLYPNNFIFIQDNFSNLEEIAHNNNIKEVDGIVFDLGVSSMQLDQAERGFSFNKEAKLDMRMGSDGIDAWEVVNKFSETDLADIIYYYGEETFARRIARNIVQSRKSSPINTTIELAKIIQSSVKRTGKTDPATKTFQAIRVYVNDELKSLKKALSSAYNLLKIDGKLVIVSFQGLEDRIIKEFIKEVPNAKAKAIKPSLEEIRRNPRARSAKLRTITRSSHAKLERVS